MKLAALMKTCWQQRAVVLCLAGIAWGAGMVRGADGLPLAAERGHWDQSVAGAWRPDPAATWNIALTREAAPANAAVETTFMIRDSGVVTLPHDSSQRFWVKGEGLFGETDLWADAALFVNYTPAAGALPQYYRVEVSGHPEASHVAIWKMGGGYLAAKPVTLDLKKPHTLKAETDQQGSIRVTLDGAEVLAYRDPMPLPAGKAGIGALKAIAEFTAFSVRPLERDVTVALPTQGDFKVRKWYEGKGALDENWVFDGDEPVFRLYNSKGGITFQWAKLRPGMTPTIADMPWFFSGIVGEDVQIEIPEEFAIVKEGPTWECRMKFKPRKGDGGSAEIHVTLQRDAAANRYTYDVDTTLKIGDKPLPYRHPYEFFDPWPAAAKGLNQEFNRALRQSFEGFAWEQPGGKPARRMNFCNDYDQFTGALRFINSEVKTPGMSAMGCEADANMVIHYLNNPGQALMGEMCMWGYDWHQRMLNESWRKTGIPANSSYNIKFQVTHEEKAAIEPLFKAAQHISAESCKFKQLPVVEWPVSTFARTADPLASRNSLLWLGGEYVQDKGHGDASSIRLKPKEKLRPSAPLGVSYFMPTKCVSAWNKTFSFDVLTEGGAAPGASRKLLVTLRSTTVHLAVNQQTFELSGEPGKWQTLTMPADALIGGVLVDLSFENVGTVPVYIDNVRFTEPPEVKKPQWDLQAEMLNLDHMIADPDAENGFALVFTPKDPTGACIFGPYDTELPAGDYRATIRIKVPDNTVTTDVMGWDVVETEGASKWGVAGANWKGTDFAAAGKYVNKEFTFHRDAGGRLSIRFYQRQAGGQYWVDKVTFVRTKDAWGNVLPEKRDRW
ncbi:MAG: hypothetical protein WCI73_03780 [Phycisphaerae bacterium]